jgi:hypothetical protein
MRLSYEAWAQTRLTERQICRVERSMSCIPLRGDPICRACFESDIEGAEEAPPGEGAGAR